MKCAQKRRAHLQCVNNNCTTFQYKVMKTFDFTDYTNEAPQKCCGWMDGWMNKRMGGQSGPTTRFVFRQGDAGTICLKFARGKKSTKKINSTEKIICYVKAERNPMENQNIRLYRTYKTTLSTQCYAKSKMGRDHQCIFARFRSCNLPLAIEMGRFTKPNHL